MTAYFHHTTDIFICISSADASSFLESAIYSFSSISLSRRRRTSDRDVTASTVNRPTAYTRWVKKQDTLLMLITTRNIKRFSQLFHSAQNLLQNDHYKSHHTLNITALSCETVVFQLLASSRANTLLKHNVNFCQCFQFPSLFQQCIKPAFRPVFHRKFC